MSGNTIPEPRDLKNKPLVEAIFEIRWDLVVPSGMPPTDPGFALFQGRYYDRVRKDFPVTVQLPAAGVPEAFAPNTVRVQFRKSQNGWPLTQIGPGVLTVNETEGYKWATYKPVLKQAVDTLFDAYPVDVSELKISQAHLRYINAIPYDPSSEELPILRFLRERLHTEVVPESLLFFDEDITSDSPESMSLNISYRVPSKQAVSGITVALGATNDKPAVILEIVVRTLPNESPGNPGKILTWLDGAHDIIDKWFFALVRGELLKKFEGE